VVLLPETDAPGGAVVAERLNAAIRATPIGAPQQAADPGDRVHRHRGVPEHGATAPRLLEVADDALYQAKAAGRDRYRLAEPVTSADRILVAVGGASGGPQPTPSDAGR
jgi:PleD family two-component response regulator